MNKPLDEDNALVIKAPNGKIYLLEKSLLPVMNKKIKDIREGTFEGSDDEKERLKKLFID